MSESHEKQTTKAELAKFICKLTSEQRTRYATLVYSGLAKCSSQCVRDLLEPFAEKCWCGLPIHFGSSAVCCRQAAARFLKAVDRDLYVNGDRKFACVNGDPYLVKAPRHYASR